MYVLPVFISCVDCACRQHVHSASVDSPQRDNGSQTDRKLCRESSRDRCESTSGEARPSLDKLASSAAPPPLFSATNSAASVATAAASAPLAGGLLERPLSASTATPRLLVIPLSPPTPHRTTPRTVASPRPSAASAASVTADVRHSTEPMVSIEFVAGVVGGGVTLAVLLAIAVAAVCRYRSREHGTYNVDAATVNGYAYEICTTSSSAGSSSTTTIGGSRRKARAVAGASAASPGGSGASGSLGRKAGKTKKKVVREWYV